MNAGLPSSTDLVVVGGGNAAFCAALAAREQGVGAGAGARAGGRGRRQQPLHRGRDARAPIDGVDDLRRLMPDLTDEEVARTDFGTYTEEQFFDDMGARHRSTAPIPTCAEILVKRSLETLLWMRGKGVRFAPIYGRQAFKVDGKFKFWGGLTVEAWGGGDRAWSRPGPQSASKHGIEVWYRARATGADRRRRRRHGRAREARRQDGRGPGQERGARRRRLRGQPRDGARATSARAGSSPRCAARASTPATDPHGARHRRRAVRQLVGLPRRGLGPQRARVRRPRGGRPVPEALLSRRASCSTPTAGASSTRAPISATTPTPSTAA